MTPFAYVEPPDVPEGMTLKAWRESKPRRKRTLWQRLTGR